MKLGTNEKYWSVKYLHFLPALDHCNAAKLPSSFESSTHPFEVKTREHESLIKSHLFKFNSIMVDSKAFTCNFLC